MELTDVKTHQKYFFAANRWLSQDEVRRAQCAAVRGNRRPLAIYARLQAAEPSLSHPVSLVQGDGKTKVTLQALIEDPREAFSKYVAAEPLVSSTAAAHAPAGPEPRNTLVQKHFALPRKLCCLACARIWGVRPFMPMV